MILNLDMYIRAVIHKVKMTRATDIRSKLDILKVCWSKLLVGMSAISLIDKIIRESVDDDHLNLLRVCEGNSRSKVRGRISFNIY